MNRSHLCKYCCYLFNKIYLFRTCFIYINDNFYVLYLVYAVTGRLNKLRRDYVSRYSHCVLTKITCTESARHQLTGLGRHKKVIEAHIHSLNTNQRPMVCVCHVKMQLLRGTSFIYFSHSM